MTASGAAVARLPRPVKLFGFVSLLNDFASEMIYPLLPAFVTGVLGAGPQALGALDGVAEFAASVVKFGAGRLADRTARRGPLIVLGYAIAVLVRPIIALTGAAWQVIGLRVVDRIGKGIRTPPRDALMADVTPAPLLGRAFGLQRGMDHAGAVLGPLTAWWLLTSGSADVRTVIGASLAPGVAVLLLWAALHVVRSSASFAGGRLTDRIGAGRTMWLGWLAYAGVAAGFALARSAGAAWTLFLAFGTVAGLTESPERALVAQLAGARQGRGIGRYHGVTGLAALAGGIGRVGVITA